MQLAARGPRSKAAAFDLTFSAPKSVSVLFAIGDEGLARALVEAHEEAVDAALAYLERDACRVRRGHNGTRGEREADDPRAFPAGAGGARRRVRRGRLPAPDVAGAGSAAAYARGVREHGPRTRWPLDGARRVEWAGVIGQPQDFSRNWSYTALSRAREPVESASLVVSFDLRPSGMESKQNSIPVTSTTWAIVSKSGLCSPDSSFAARGG